MGDSNISANYKAVPTARTGNGPTEVQSDEYGFLLVRQVAAGGVADSYGSGVVDAGTQRVTQAGAPTGTQSIVASSGSNVTILAANASRRGGAVFNDSTQILYLLAAAGTSSATVHTLQMAAGSYYEIPANYTGALSGLWASANGSARVTEYT